MTRAPRSLLATEEFIAKAVARHGSGRYDYSQVRYVHSREPVTIVCPEDDHGPFEQTPNTHLRPRGCPICAQTVRIPRRLSMADFVARAREVHAGRYDYSKAVYTSLDRPVTIVCPDCGPYEQLAHNHLDGHGCRSCSTQVGRLTTAQFIDKARAVHGDDRYDYSQTSYTNSRSKLTIICRDCGPYEQLANSHLRGHGCPGCARAGRSRPRRTRA